jgi:hypothetical protein
LSGRPEGRGSTGRPTDGCHARTRIFGSGPSRHTSGDQHSRGSGFTQRRDGSRLRVRRRQAECGFSPDGRPVPNEIRDVRVTLRRCRVMAVPITPAPVRRTDSRAGPARRVGLEPGDHCTAADRGPCCRSPRLGLGFHRLDLGPLLGMYLLTAVGITVGFHQPFVHRTYATYTGVKFVLAAVGSMAVVGS